MKISIEVGGLVSGGRSRARAMVVQQKTGRPLQFKVYGTGAERACSPWLTLRGGALDDYVFLSRTDHADHLGTRQYARLVDEWVAAIGPHCEDYGTHSLLRTKASVIYKATGNLRVVQVLFDHTRSKVQFAISAWMSRTHSNSPKVQRSSA